MRGVAVWLLLALLGSSGVIQCEERATRAATESSATGTEAPQWPAAWRLWHTLVVRDIVLDLRKESILPLLLRQQSSKALLAAGAPPASTPLPTKDMIPAEYRTANLIHREGHDYRGERTSPAYGEAQQQEPQVSDTSGASMAGSEGQSYAQDGAAGASQDSGLRRALLDEKSSYRHPLPLFYENGVWHDDDCREKAAQSKIDVVIPFYERVWRVSPCLTP